MTTTLATFIILCIIVTYGSFVSDKHIDKVFVVLAVLFVIHIIVRIFC